MQTLILVLLCLWAWSLPAFADISRCQMPTGEVRYQDAPCAPDESTVLIQESPGTPHQQQLTAPAGASHVTTAESMACLMPWWLTEWQVAREKRDALGQKHLVTSGKCFVPKPGLPVSVLTETTKIPTARLHVRLYIADSAQSIEVWMAPWDIVPVAR